MTTRVEKEEKSFEGGSTNSSDWDSGTILNKASPLCLEAPIEMTTADLHDDAMSRYYTRLHLKYNVT